MRSILDEVMREMEPIIAARLHSDQFRLVAHLAAEKTLFACRAALLAGRIDLIVPETPPEERRVPPHDWSDMPEEERRK